MPALFSNNASTTLAAGITNAATSITVATGTGALFPALSGANFFYGTLVDGSGNIEIVKVTARSGDTMTVVRGQDNTTARAYSSGAKFELRVTAAGLANKVDYDDASFAVTMAQVTGLTAALAAIYQIPSGTKTDFFQAAAPTGWAQITTYNDVALRVVSGTGGGTHTSGSGLSTFATGTTGGHSITQAELPNCNFPVTDPGHTHPIKSTAIGGGGGAGHVIGGSNIGDNTDGHTTGISVASGGSGTAHTHAMNININYVDMILCSKS